MNVLIWVPDERAEEFVRKFVPSGVVDTSWYGNGVDEDGYSPVMEMLPISIEKIYTSSP